MIAYSMTAAYCEEFSGEIVSWTVTSLGAFSSLVTRQGQRVLAYSGTVEDVWFMIGTSGSPTGTIYCRIRDADDDSVIAESTTTYDSSTIKNFGQLSNQIARPMLKFSFPSVVITARDVRFCLEYADGVGGATIQAVFSAASGPAAGNLTRYISGVWNDSLTNDIALIVNAVNPPADSIDGSLSTYSPTDPQSATYLYDMGQSRVINGVKIYFSSDIAERPTSFEILVNDGAGWTSALVVAVQPSAGWNQYVFADETCRYFKLNISGGAKPPIYEIQALYSQSYSILELAFGAAVTDVAPSWTDVSTGLVSLSIRRGRMHDLDRVEAGTAVFVLNNASGDYWRDNAAGSYYPDVKPLTLIRFNAMWESVSYGRFYGVVESWKHGWLSEQGGKVPIVTVSCVDIFKSFSRLKLYPLTGTVAGNQETVALASNAASGQADVVIKSLNDDATEGADIKLLHVGQSVTIADNNNSEVNEIASINEDTYTLTMANNLANTYTTAASGYIKKFPAVLSGTRVDDVLAELGWPAALADIDTGQVTLAEFVPDADGTPALDHLFAIADSEGGIIFVSGLGTLVFQDRDARLDPTVDAVTCLDGTLIALDTVQATFSDDGADQKYVMAALEDDDTFIYNEAIVVGDAITAQIYRDITSQDNQGPRPFARSGSLLSVNGDAFDQAYTIVERYKDSVLRLPSLVVVPDADPSNLYSKVLLYDLSTRINVELNQSPNPAGLDRDYHIEGIEDDWKAGQVWKTKWQLWDVNLFRIIQAIHTGYLHKESLVSYVDAHDAASATDVYNDNAVIGVGQANDGGSDWRIFRGYLEFDTSSIGAAATIASAELILEITGYFVINNAFDLQIVPATGVTTGGALVAADYGDLLDDTTDYGKVTISTPAVNKKIIVVTLTAAGIAAINKTGITSFGLRSSRDISSGGPTGSQQEYVTVSGSGSDVVPRLAVKLNEVF